MTNPRRGFTLVELMVTISILGVLALITVPQLTTYLPNLRVNGAAKALASELLLARMRAASTNRLQHVTFDPTAQTVKFEEEDPGGTLTTVKTLALATQFPNVRIDYNSVTGVDGSGPVTAAVKFGSAGGEAVFLPNGLLQNSGVVYLIPAGDKGTARNDRMRALRVSLAGQVALLRYASGANPPWEEY